MSQKLQQLLNTLQTHPVVTSNEELNTLSKSIENEVTKLLKQVNKTEKTDNTSSANIDEKSGCYVFEGISGYFCPNCFDNQQQRVNTKRLNSKLRICPQCRASITPK